MVKIARHKDAISEFLELEANPVEGSAKRNQRRKGNAKKKLQKSKSLKT